MIVLGLFLLFTERHRVPFLIASHSRLEGICNGTVEVNGQTTVARGQTNLDTVCNNVVNTLDCTSFAATPLCASNNVEYRTECDFAKAHCVDPNLKVVTEGSCSVTTAPGQMTTMQNPETGTTTDPNLSDLCNQLVNTPCSTDSSNPLCGTDGNTYINYCKYSKGKCFNPALQIGFTGACPTTTVTTTTTTTTPAPSVFEIICRTQVTCVDNGVQVCGSDGVTYATACDFEKAKCKDESLTVQSC